MITRVTPPGHTSLKGGVLTMREAAHAFNWARNLLVKIDFEDGEPHLVQIRYKVYGDGNMDAELELCTICHQHKGHCRDCPNKETKKMSRTAKVDKYSRKIKEDNEDGNPCTWFELGLCFYQHECQLKHNKDITPSFIACALPRASKNKPHEWGLPTEALMCKAGKKCFYHHRDWTPELNKDAYAAIEEDPTILA